MLKQKKTKFVLILIFIFLPLLIQNPQEERDETNHNKEYKALLKKAIDMHKLLNELKKERKPDKEKYKELQKATIRKLQRWYMPITSNQSQKKAIKPSSEESKKKIKKLSFYGIKNTQTQSVWQLKTLPYQQMKPAPLSNSISLRSRANNITLRLPKIAETKSLSKPPLLEYNKRLSIKKENLLHKLTELQKKIEEAIAKCRYKYDQDNSISCERFVFGPGGRKVNSIVNSLKSFNVKIKTLISEMTETKCNELDYEKLEEFNRLTLNYYQTNINELINELSEKVKKVNNLTLKVRNLEELLPKVAEGKEPYSYLSLKERRALYQSLCRKYKEIINELKPDRNAISFFHFYKFFPRFISKPTKEEPTKTQNNPQQTTLIVNKMKELTSLSVLLDEIDSIITYLNDVKNFIGLNLQAKQIDVFNSPEEEKNCESVWKEEVEKGELKNLIAFDKEKVVVKNDFLLLSDKETLNEINRKAKTCSDNILPERIKKLFNGLKVIRGRNVVPITTYQDLFNYVNTTMPPLLEDIEKTKATSIYQFLSDSIRHTAQTCTDDEENQLLSDENIIKSQISNSGLDGTQIECIVENITKTQKIQAIAVTGDAIKLAFKECDITIDKEKEIMEYMIEKQINNRISFEKLLTIVRNSDRIVKLFVELFNFCSKVYIDDIPKIIKFKYDVFVKTFDFLWSKFLSAPDTEFLSNTDFKEWKNTTYERNKKAWQDKYICPIRLHQYATRLLNLLYGSFQLNRNLLTKLCLDEIEAMNLEKDKQKKLQTKFWELLGGSLPKACRIIKIYQKGMNINKVEDINKRIETLFEYRASSRESKESDLNYE